MSRWRCELDSTSSDRLVRLACAILAISLFAPALGAAPEDSTNGARIRYGRDVLPILAAKCFACHGPDARARKAKLRLDARDAAIAPRRKRAAIVPGEPSASALVRRIRSSDPDERMPPPDAEESLTAAEIEILSRWIEDGASYERHWAYAPPRRAAVPEVQNRAWPRGAIDGFVLARLDAEGIAPSPPADRHTLARRLSLDLLGFAPSPEEHDAFLADEHPEAYERLVDRLLASPAFAERLAVYWFDLVRFADTTGIHADNTWDIYPYRDWVIDALASDMPFDEFSREQLGGDLIPDASLEQRVAASYNRLNLITREGGSQAKEFLVRYTNDRVRNATSVWMATTLGCAQCHDHKFDPLSSREFYAFGAFFADIEQVGVYAAKFPPYLKVPSGADRREIFEIGRQLEQLSSRGENGSERWTPLLARELRALEPGVELRRLEDQSVLAVGANPTKNTYTLTFEAPPAGVSALRLELLRDPGLPREGPGRAKNGNLVVSEIVLNAKGQRLELSHADATFSQKGFPVAAAIDGKSDDRGGWAVLDDNGAVRPAHAIFELREPWTGDTPLEVTLHQNHGNGPHTLGRFRIAALPARDADRLADLREQRSRRETLEDKRRRLEKDTPVVMLTRATTPMEVRVRPRGNWMDDSGDVVSPGVPAAFGTLDVEGRPTRLDLAEWLFRPENPVVARVFVNRIWKLLLGRGLVATLDDFGLQGTPPSHPELLDHLALEFRDRGWSVRQLVRDIVLSETYRQSSLPRPELRERDPDNVLLARQSRFRLDAEFIRDNALRVSGLLSRRLKGPSVRPYQPDGYYAHLNFPRRRYQHDKGESLYRRTIYTHWQRQFVHPSLLAFDAPSRERCTVDRPRSNTPLAALVLLNDPIYVEAAKSLASRIIESPSRTTEERLRFAFGRALNRTPLAREARLLRELFRTELTRFQGDEPAARELLSTGEFPVPRELDPAAAAELAAWTSTARVLLNLHESLTRY